MTAGIAVAGLGHSDPGVTEALTEQSTKLIASSNLFHNIKAGELAEKLVLSTKHPQAQAPWASKVFFSNSGTEANEGALKFARKLGHNTGNKLKYGLVSFLGGFHGRSLGALTATPNPKYQTPFQPLIPGFIHLPLNDLKALDAINENVCGVMVEPIQGEGGVKLCTEEFLYKLRQKCDRFNIALIYDEIQCGLGRTGKLWAHHHFPSELAPDMVTIAKPLGNGFPIGAVIVNDKIAKALAVGDHGTTFGGNPLGTAVALSVFDRINSPELLKNVEEVGKLIRLEFQKFQHDSILEVRGRGLINAIAFNYNSGVDPAKVCAEARARGLITITAADNTIRLVPPLIITKEQALEAVAILKDSILEVANQAARNSS
jgi:acetylornithine aminotransferase